MELDESLGGLQAARPAIAGTPRDGARGSLTRVLEQSTFAFLRVLFARSSPPLHKPRR